MHKLIGLAGAIGSGKSTAAKILVDKLGYEETTFKFELASRIFSALHIQPCDRQYLDLFNERELKEKPSELLGGKTPRQVMYSFSDWIRSIDPDALVKPVEYRVKRYDWIFYVVSDVRFENEAKMIKRNGGVIWQIERQDNPFANKVLNTGRVTTFDGFFDRLSLSEPIHESERGLDPKYIDLTIHNNGSLDDLATAIEDALEVAEAIK